MLWYAMVLFILATVFGFWGFGPEIGGSAAAPILKAAFVVCVFGCVVTSVIGLVRRVDIGRGL